MDILYEDAQMIVVNKPTGILSVPTTHGREKSMLDLLADYQREKSQMLGVEQDRKASFQSVHRLDREVSGVLLFAKGKKVQEHLMNQFKDRRVRKTYLAVVNGVIPKEQAKGKINIPIDDNRPKAMAIPHKGQPAETSYEVLKAENGLTFVRAATATGRRHQIRLHFAEAFSPLVGDRLYGQNTPGNSPKLRGIALHAEKIIFSHPHSNQKMTLVAPLPQDWLESFGALVK